MKTKSITLRENDSMVRLSIYTSKTIDELTNIIMECLISQGIIYDIPEESAETLEYLLIEEGRTLEQFTVYCFKFSNPTLINILKGVQFWGIENECMDCGCRMEEKEDEKECINPVCGCSINTDFSPDPDDYRDDCKLNNPIKLKYLSIHNLN